jgi:NADH dehydrogenase FAD-containing subunit
LAEQRKPHVLVIGGGFAGRRAERMLRRNASLDTTLVDGGGFFEYTPAALRVMVHPAEALSTVIPQPARATVAAVTGVEVAPAADGSVPSLTAVTLSDGRRLPCDYVLFATGSSYAAPIKAAQSDWPGGLHGRHRHYRTCCTQLEAVTSALVIGGGTVGVELAAEIADKWRDAKRVTLVASSLGLLDRLPPAAGRAAASWLRRAGVDLILGEKVTDYGGAEEAGWGVPGPYTVSTSSGRTLTAGAVFNCTGGKPLSAYLRTVPGALDAKGLIQCLPSMRLKALRNAYAAGDVADHGVEATAMNADLTAVVAARNIAACVAGGSAQPAVFPQGACFGASFAPDVQAVSLGKYNGVMVFNQLVLSGPPVAALKWTIEAMQLATARGFTLPTAVWGQVENLTVFMGTKLFRGRGRANQAAS